MRFRHAVWVVVVVASVVCTTRGGESTTDTEAKTLTVAVVSSHSEFCDTGANLKHFESLIEEAAGKGARLVCFPELALMAYSTEKEILNVAEEIPGPSTEKLAAIARSHDVYLSVGMAEKSGEKYHIAQAVIGPDGYIGKYRKYHPTGTEQKCGFSPGEEFPVFDVDGFRFGINICADGRQEDTIQAMKDAKVDVIHHPHGNYPGLGKDAEEWTRGKMVYFVPRAIFSRAYILINNSAGDTKHPRGVNEYGSGALAIDPLGQVLDRTTQQDRQEKMIVVEIKRPLSALVPPFELRRLHKR
ncbi:MAG: carbon-nitrogen hydrolase family protein [Planctomycetes bacterium]|nr:carbon-nitrogen hydrolase family protein [Planctomycetota bacterium]